MSTTSDRRLSPSLRVLVLVGIVDTAVSVGFVAWDVGQRVRDWWVSR